MLQPRIRGAPRKFYSHEITNSLEDEPKLEVVLLLQLLIEASGNSFVWRIPTGDSAFPLVQFLSSQIATLNVQPLLESTGTKIGRMSRLVGEM